MRFPEYVGSRYLLNHATLSVNSLEKKEEYAVEFAKLAHTFEELEHTSSRLKLIELYKSQGKK